MTLLLCLAPLLFSQERNATCPVMSGEKTDARYSATYAGRTVYFCCERCVREFQERPARFLPDAAPPLAGRWHQRRALVPVAAALAGAALLLRRRRGWTVAGLALLAAAAAAWLLTLLLDRVVETERPDGVNVSSMLGVRVYAYAALPGLLVAFLGCRPGRISALVAASRARPLALGLGAAALAVATSWAALRFQRSVREQRDDFLHFATFKDFGRPPRPHPPERKALGGVWYRGNDERHGRLPNGGNYRTCVFTVRLEAEDGRPLAPGEAAGGKAWIALLVERSPNTKESLYADRIFSKCFLTRESDPYMGSAAPVGDRVGFETLRPLWRWRARYPLEVPADGELRGIVYVCEEQVMDARTFFLGDTALLGGEGTPRMIMGGGRFHYAIQYDLAFRGGRLEPGSALWMGSLYRTRKYTLNELPYHEWFSERPIPEADSMSRNVVLPESPDREDR